MGCSITGACPQVHMSGVFEWGISSDLFRSIN